MRILTGTLMHETNTFNPQSTVLADFRPLLGDALFTHDFWRGNAESTGGIVETLQAEGVEVLPSVHAVAMVSGTVTDEAYAEIRSSILEAIRAAGPLDGICFCLHGSMRTASIADPEGDLMSAIRGIVGPRLPIVVTLDMHAKVTDALIRSVNAFAVFRTAPHTDRYDTGVRAAELLLRIIRRKLDVVTVAAKIPFLVCGENSMTDVEPMRELIAAVYETSRQKHVLNADYTLGFPWADTPHHGACALISGETVHRDALIDDALSLASRMWEKREQFVFSERAYPLDEALDEALREREGLAIVSDTGDNPTAGAAGDLTIVLERLLARGISGTLVAVIADPASYEVCLAAGAGAEVELALGKRTTDSDEPFHARAIVLSVHAGLDRAGHSKEISDAAVVRIGEVDVIVAKRRIAVYDPAYLTQLGLDISQYRLIVVKSGYLSPQYRSLGTKTLFALTPGHSSIVLRALRFSKAPDPLYPRELDTVWRADEERKRMAAEAELLPMRGIISDHAHEPIFAIPFSPAGYEKYGAHVTRRRLSQLRHLYGDPVAVDQILAREDPVVYEVYEMPYPYRETDLLINITVLYPGRVGGEPYMTKGHFHAEPDTAEAVIGLEGDGEMLLQRRDGELRKVPVSEGTISYAGGGWAHRVVNTGSRPLVFFAVSGANIVHDYETAERLNFS
ncbi:M81 family metallopeptidase [Cohnella hashimotonis]|uniref:glucose-6-phosphate isomerase n=1 Tax=Cohnella hashimotonis TaxID=2826895 RepID=A0ABT6TE97_9BACL|nr:M81 family metallopeptidase [Cohnella hashimotonis]MDI4645137.1 M81 family metallopeptidase [Cohnella hashimotonis]